MLIYYLTLSSCRVSKSACCYIDLDKHYRISRIYHGPYRTHPHGFMYDKYLQHFVHTRTYESMRQSITKTSGCDSQYVVPTARRV